MNRIAMSYIGQIYFKEIKMKIILSIVAVLAMFTGCTSTTDAAKGAVAKKAKGAATDVAKSAVSDAKSKAVDTAKGAATDAVKGSLDSKDIATSALTEKSLKDVAVDKAKNKAVDMADSKTGGAASKVIDAVK